MEFAKSRAIHTIHACAPLLSHAISAPFTKFHAQTTLHRVPLASLESMYVTPDISGVEIEILGAAAQKLGAKIEILGVLAKPLA